MRSRCGVALVVALGAVFAASAGAGMRAAPSGRIVFAANRLPDFYGEIYRLDLDGRRVDLSNSTAQDVAPAVSPDGTRVAFASNRGGRIALYVVGIDGTGLVRVSPELAANHDATGLSASIAWSPDGKALAAALSAPKLEGLWVGTVGGGGRFVARGPVLGVGWAPDGRAIAYEPGNNEVDVVAPTGRLLWHVLGDAGSATWSSRGRLALAFHGTTTRVYTERGRSLASFAGTQPAWSPDGTRLATLRGASLQVRVNGVGSPTVDARVLRRNVGGTVQWLGNSRVRVQNAVGWTGFDVRAKRPWRLPQGFAAFTYPPVASRDGRMVAVVTYGGTNAPVSIRVATLSGGLGPALQSVPFCSDDLVFTSPQFVPGGRALVYQSGCPVPSGDIYSAAADGSDVRRLTSTSTDETQPAVSPDGTQVAYVQQLFADRCKGCPDTIWQMRADGGAQRALTRPASNGDAWDNRPSWSPDGTRIVFWHSTISSFGHLVTVPAGGGPQRRLPIAGGYPAWGPTRLAYISTGGVIQTSLPDGSDVRTVAKDPNAMAQSLAWSPDGRLGFIEQAANGALALVVDNGGALERHLLGGVKVAPEGSGLAWSPDGTRLAFTAADARSGISDVYTADADGTNVQRLTHDLEAIGPLSWSSR
jgi:Tol biopolymer transport system component